jgi:hypothetical protein
MSRENSGRTSEAVVGDADAALRRLLTEIIRASSKKRAQIAEEMSALLGQHVSEYMLHDFSAPSKRPARFPAAFIEAFCEVLGDDRLQRFLMGERLRKLVALAERELSACLNEGERQRLRGELLAKEDRRER